MLIIISLFNSAVTVTVTVTATCPGAPLHQGKGAYVQTDRQTTILLEVKSIRGAYRHVSCCQKKKMYRR